MSVHARPDTEASVRETYRRRARHYDLTANAYYLLGFREWAYRELAIAVLEPRPGDKVVEVGCGTGLNFRLLERAVGPAGSIIGVDLTDAMLEQARRRVAAAGWRNVELVLADAAEYQFPGGVDGILSTFALSLSPRCGEIVASGSRALAPGGRWVVLDFQVPGWMPSRLIPVVLPLVRPFAVTEEAVARRPWEQIREAMERHLVDVTVETRFGGIAYVMTGRRRS